MPLPWAPPSPWRPWEHGDLKDPGPPSHPRYTNTFRPPALPGNARARLGFPAAEPGPARRARRAAPAPIYRRQLGASTVSHTGQESPVGWVTLGENAAVFHHDSFVFVNPKKTGVGGGCHGVAKNALSCTTAHKNGDDSIPSIRRGSLTRCLVALQSQIAITMKSQSTPETGYKHTRKMEERSCMHCRDLNYGVHRQWPFQTSPLCTTD